MAGILQTRRESIYIWRRNWQDKGLGGLAEGRHNGRPGMLGEEQLRYLAELADQGGYAVPQLLALLQKRWPEVAMQPASLRRVLRRQGFRWKRTRYSLKKRPQPAYQLAIEQLERFQAATQRGEIDLAYFDESGFSVNPVLRYAWIRAGEQKAVFR